MKLFYVYLLANNRNGTLYAGHTDDLRRRTWEHRIGKGSAFSSKYGVKRLVWYETCDTREAAKTREYQIKKWKRDWKLQLIEKRNPNWDDLYDNLNNELPLD